MADVFARLDRGYSAVMRLRLAEALGDLDDAPLDAPEDACRGEATGRITIAQWPNPALWVVIAAAAVREVLSPHGDLGSVVHWVGTAAILLWAVDELARGVNPWRRILGALVLLSTIRGLT